MFPLKDSVVTCGQDLIFENWIDLIAFKNPNVLCLADVKTCLAYKGFENGSLVIAT